jgi:hypothetical protein
MAEGAGIDPQAASEIVASATAALLAIADADVRRNTIDGDRALELTREVTAELAPFLPHLNEHVSAKKAAERVADLAALPEQARVFLAAEIGATNPWSPEQVKRRKHLTKQAAENDQSLVLWLRPYLTQDEDGRALLAEVTPGSGIRDNAWDTSRMADDAVVRMDSGALPQQVGPWTRASLRTASAEAVELLTNLNKSDDNRASPANMRNRAFTQWAATYTRLQNLGRFLAGELPEQGGTFAGIYTPPKKKAAAPEVPEAPEVPQAPPVSETEDVTS